MQPASVRRGGETEHEGLQALHPTTLQELSVERIVVDPRLVSNSLVSKCTLCKQTLIAKKQGLTQISFRKSQSVKGFVVTAFESRAKGQRKQQALCLECVKRHIGCVTVTSLTVSVTEESAQIWFERSSPADAWRQQKSLLGEEIVAACNLKEEEAWHEFSGRCTSTAAEAAVNKGRHAGEIPRKASIQTVRK
jgi:hypothetical protein